MQEKIVTIDGQKIRLRNSGRTLMIYKGEMGRDFMSDMQEVYQTGFVNASMLMGITWAMAKTADSDTKPFLDWSDDFSMTSFTKKEVARDVMALVNDGQKVDAKNA